MNDSFLRRAVVGTAFVLLVTGLTYVGGVAFLFLALAVIGLGLAEFYAMTGGFKVSPFRLLGIALGAGVTVGAFLWGPAGLGGASAVACLVCLVVGVSRPAGGTIARASITAAGVLYVASLGAHMVTLREGPGLGGLEYSAGFRAAMYAFAATWCCDTCAYLFGRAFGRHKMFPSVSPKKSWEGAVAGLVGAIGGLTLVNWALGGSMTFSGLAALGMAIGVAAQLGDLVESRIKRLAGVKDSSKLLPGHGGILDRFDGFLFVAPLVYYYFFLSGYAGL
jgi:phosphatidate cytidylyltransferase